MSSVSDPGQTAAGWRPGAMWSVALAGIAIWVVHLTAEAALVGLAERHHEAIYLMHALTVVLTLVTVGCVLLCLRLARHAARPEAEWSTGGRTAFIGWFGVVTGIASVVLIVVEGTYIATIAIART
jgi:hypothetical protein